MKHNWEYKKLGEIGTIITGSTPSTTVDDYYNSSDYMFVKPGDIDEQGINILNKSETYISNTAYNMACRKLPKHTILVTCIGIIGKVGILQKEGCCNQQINAIIPYTYINHKYLGYAILSIKDILNSQKNGPVVPIINKSQFSKIPIPVPPMAVQERIVAELDKINEVMEDCRELLRNLDTLAQSLFYTYFGDPITNPKAWEVKNLADICSAISTGITYKPDNVTNKGTIVLRSSNIQNNSFVLDDVVHIDMPLKQTQYVKKNDILMCSRNGSARLVGKVALIPDLSEKMSWGAFMTIIRSDFYHFLFQYFRLPAFRNQLTKTKTTTVNQITIGMLKKILLPVPPLPLQEKFAKDIEAIEAVKATTSQQLAELQTLLDSRMDYWFN